MDIRGLGYERVRQLLDAGLIDERGRPVPDPERAAGRAGPLREAVGGPAGGGDRGLQVAPALQSAVRPGHPARGQDRRGAAGPPVRHHAGADAGARKPRSTPSRASAPRSPRRWSRSSPSRGTWSWSERLERAGLTFTEPGAAGGDGALSGKTYVITGTLPTLSRARGHRAHRGGGRPGRRQREQEDRCGRGGRGGREQAGEGERARRRGHRRGRALASRRSQVLRSTVLNPLDPMTSEPIPPSPRRSPSRPPRAAPAPLRAGARYRAPGFHLPPGGGLRRRRGALPSSGNGCWPSAGWKSRRNSMPSS